MIERASQVTERQLVDALGEARARLAGRLPAQIEVEVTESPTVLAADSVYFFFADCGKIRVARCYLEECTDVEAAFAVFHEVGHLYCQWLASGSPGLAFPTHDEEFGSDYIGGWLLGQAGFLMVDGDTGDQFGAPLSTELSDDGGAGADGMWAARAMERATISRLIVRFWNPTGAASTHPAAFDRISRATINGWIDAVTGRPLRF